MIQIGISILKLDIFFCNYTKTNVGNYTALIKVMVVFRQNTVAFLFLKCLCSINIYFKMNNFWKRKVVNVEENYLKLKWGPGIACGNIVGDEVMKLQQNVDPKQQLFSKM